MMLLEQMHPNIFVEFCRGFFVINKTGNKFSSIAVGQVHEQNNTLVKGDGGAVGLTENHQAMNRWMLAGLDTARVIHEFEDTIRDRHRTHRTGEHHEESKSVQARYVKEVKALVEVVEGMGSPFLESSGDLLVLDTKDIADPAVVKNSQRNRADRREEIC